MCQGISGNLITQNNVIIIAAILIFVVLYSGLTTRESDRRQIEYFENTTVAMERVTENYLEGEQRICDVWANYINNKTMTMEEATEYIRSSHVLTNTSAHLVFLDTLTLYDSESKTSEEAFLLRVMPISELEQKWVYPQDGV